MAVTHHCAESVIGSNTRSWLVTGLPLRGQEMSVSVTRTLPHTQSIASRHLPPHSARFSYATEGALFIHRRCQRPPKGVGTNKTVEASGAGIAQWLERRTRD